MKTVFGKSPARPEDHETYPDEKAKSEYDPGTSSSRPEYRTSRIEEKV